MRQYGWLCLSTVAAVSLSLLASREAAAGGLGFADHASMGAGASVEAPVPHATERSAPPEPVALEVGARFAALPDAGFDPYSDDDFLAQLSAAAALRLLQRGPLTVSMRAGWDFGESSGYARGATTSLALHRLSLGGEALVSAAPWLGVFVRVAPAALHLRGTIEDASDPRPLESRSWTWGLDASAGAALRFARIGEGSSLWLSAETGYGFAGAADMEFTPDGEDQPEIGDSRVGATVLPELRPAGAMTRFALTLRF